MDKPREFWISEGYKGQTTGTTYPASVTSIRPEYETTLIHVIEYSAYEKLDDELTDFKLNDPYFEENVQLTEKVCKLSERIRELESEIEAIKYEAWERSMGEDL